MFRDRKKMQTVWQRLVANNTQVVFLDFRVLSTRGFWTGIFKMSGLWREKRSRLESQLWTLKPVYQCRNDNSVSFLHSSTGVKYVRFGAHFGPFTAQPPTHMKTAKIARKMELSPVKRKKSSTFRKISYPKTLDDFFWCAQIYLDEKKNLFVFDCIELPFPSFLDPYGPNRSFDTIPLQG